jgi:hypothetical protein
VVGIARRRGLGGGGSGRKKKGRGRGEADRRAPVVSAAGEKRKREGVRWAGAGGWLGRLG